MSVRFVLGRPGTGKTAGALAEIRDRLRENPNGTPLIYLVPEHMTFSMEYALATTPGLGGMTRLNVYSLPRLALRVLQQAGGATRKHLNATGISMLLRKIVEQKKGELRLFQKASRQNGFYDLLSDTLIEFKRFRLEPEEIADEIRHLSGDDAEQQLLRDKLHDLSLIYQSFSQALEGKYIDSEDYLNLMAERMDHADFLKEAEVWIDGFQTMTPQEMLIAERLMEQCRRVTILLSTDQAYEHAPDEYSVFRHSAMLFLQLKERAELDGLSIEAVHVKKQILRPDAPALTHLIGHFGQYPLKKSGQTEGVTCTEAANRREEVEQTARRLIAYARSGDSRFRDMTVLVRNLDDYYDLLVTIFEDYQIPFFIDQKMPMKHHPLIEFIRSALETIQQNWRYEPLFRCVKTDFLIPLEADMDEAHDGLNRLENYIIAHGFYGKKWTDGEPWHFQIYRGLEEINREQSAEEMKTERLINKYRMIVAEPLAALEGQLRGAVTVAEQCTALYDFLVASAVPEKLERMALRDERKNRLTEAKEHGQVWKALIELLDQCVEASGEERINLDLFISIMDAGLDALEFAMVPPALDQVLIGSLDRIRSTEIRHVFLLGVNEGVLPAKLSEHGLLSGKDRELLQDTGMTVGAGETEQMSIENELIYRALTLAKNGIHLSFPLASEDGESLRPSPLIMWLKRLFPDLVLRQTPGETRSLRELEQLALISAPQKTIGLLAAQLREWRSGYPIAELWWDAYNWFIAHREWGHASQMAISSLFARNDEQLSLGSARALYGETIQTSVSRMEKFVSCPFSQFAAYGLKLNERDVFQLSAPDIGQLFHLAIKRMTAQVMHTKRNWQDLSPEECDRLAADTVNDLAPRLQRQILTSSNRYRYMQHKLTQVVARVARVMRRHAQLSGFSPVSLELPFGPGAPLPALEFPLKGGARMEVVGRIDRVDRARDDQGRLLLRVIDYKSGAKNLNLSEVYYGLALQMLTYLDVIITYSRQWLGAEADPAGVLYFHVHNPVLNLDERLPEDELEHELYKRFKMKGLLLQDEEALRLTDQSANGGQSEIAPFGVKKNGEFYKNSSLAGKEEFETLRHYTRQIMTETGCRIIDGDVTIAPYKFDGQVPCAHCSFRPVCRFDQSQPGNQYRLLKKMSDENVLKKVAELGAKTDEHETE
ncbi:helicase-exonuclease AddAB subunit AddB [Sporolactobacillus sp. CPB3-1]|uniref:ATP-dependent helicase/deoxyribonuclease subunit B n=1 Tax=Sporolactobacillus mangiferae TaxID=2940498 RepID=A0ABT0M875_9BACL|nr:helicase-exonuclease AddAB subunit AddB [Sporolactobacillus mangiferae]MCL1631072.1 helicase-exonuclease AddAB subunit AddB [Sporolactobacillus mangiferae]